MAANQNVEVWATLQKCMAKIKLAQSLAMVSCDVTLLSAA